MPRFSRRRWALHRLLQLDRPAPPCLPCTTNLALAGAITLSCAFPALTREPVQAVQGTRPTPRHF